MFSRVITSHLVERARGTPIVTLTGPRQSGKTTLVRQVFPDHAYISLERPDERRFALEDPLGFLARFPGRLILDEVQRAPELLSYIQTAVDESPVPGRYILTGSSNLLLMEGVSQSLAGRTGILLSLPPSFSGAGRWIRGTWIPPSKIRRLPRRRSGPRFGQDSTRGFTPPGSTRRSGSPTISELTWKETCATCCGSATSMRSSAS